MKAPKVTPCQRSSPYTIPSSSTVRSHQDPKRAQLPLSSPTWNTRVALLSESILEEQQNRQAGLSYETKRTAVKVPHPLPEDVKLWDIAQGNNLGGNMTCFRDYQHLRDTLTWYFSTVDGYMDKIHASFDKYRQLMGNRADNKKLTSTKKPRRCGNHDGKENLDWSSSIFADYVFFLLEYFVPRAPYRGASDRMLPAHACGLQLGRDRTIEYLLSVCTGVVFTKKSVSSHWQQVRNRLGGPTEAHPDRRSAEYLSIFHGFEGDFPEYDNPMVDEMDWMVQCFEERHSKLPKSKQEAAETTCPVILPPVLAVILEPIKNASRIDWSRMEFAFVFSHWTVPQGLHARYVQEQSASDARAKAAAEERKNKKQGNSSESPVISRPEQRQDLQTTIDSSKSLEDGSKGKQPMRRQEHDVCLAHYNSTTIASSSSASPVELDRQLAISSGSSQPDGPPAETTRVQNATSLLIEVFGCPTLPRPVMGAAGPGPSSLLFHSLRYSGPE